MTRLSLLFVAILVAACFAGGCFYPARALSPPTVMPPFGSVGPLEPGGVEVGFAAQQRNERRGSNVSSLGLHTRFGLLPALELNFGGRAGRPGANVSPGTTQYAFRTGVRLTAPALRDIFSIDIGVGGGTHDGGTFASPDLALTGGFGRAEAPVVPLLRFESWGSLPIDSQPQQVIVDWEDPEPFSLFNRDQVPVYEQQAPENTFGWMIRLGARFRTSGSTVGTGTSIDCSFGLGAVSDSVDSMYAHDFTCGMSFRSASADRSPTAPPPYVDPLAPTPTDDEPPLDRMEFDPLWPG